METQKGIQRSYMSRKLIIISSILFTIFLIYFGSKVWIHDVGDRARPYGLDMKRNEKFPKEYHGEKYGKNVFWGKPAKNDNLRSNIDKIEWLTNSYTREPTWRRSIALAIAGAVALSIIFSIQSPAIMVVNIIIIYVAIFSSHSYYAHHILGIKQLFIKTHVRRMRRKLNLPMYNNIKDDAML